MQKIIWHQPFPFIQNGLIEDLDDLHNIKVLKISNQPKPKLSEKYGGKLPKDIQHKLQNYVPLSREEWNDRNI
jgi:hypothetical protein